MNATVKKGLRITLRIILGLILFVILVALSLFTAPVQNLIKNRVITYLEKKTDTDINLKKIRIRFPNSLTLSEFYIADKKDDTLIYANRLVADLDMIGLFSNRVELNNIELHSVLANVYRTNPDTIFNYQFLVDSLVSNEQQTKDDTTSAGLNLDLDKILLDDVVINYRDDVVGNNAGLSVGKMIANVKKFDIDARHYALDNLELDSTTLLYNQYKPLTVLQSIIDEGIDSAKAQNEGMLPVIEFGNLRLGHVNFTYDDKLSDTKVITQLNEMGFKQAFIDLTAGIYKSKEGYLNNSVVSVDYRPTASNEAALQNAADSVKGSPFNLYVDKISLVNNKFSYNNLSMPDLKGRFDANHINMWDLSAEGTDMIVDSSGIEAFFNSGKLKDSSGFELQALKGDFAFTEKELFVKDFHVKTPTSDINTTTVLQYSSQDDLSDHPEKVKMDVALENSMIDFQDLYYLVPDFPAEYRQHKFRTTASVSGYMNNMNLEKLQLSGLQNTHADIRGTIRGLPDINNTVFDLNIGRLSTSRNDLVSFLPKNTIPSNITLPGRFIASGTYQGGITKFNTDLNIQSDFGRARIDGNMDLATNNESYKADIQLQQFNLGKLLQMEDQVGKVTLTTSVDGKKFDPKQAVVNLNGVVQSAEYNNYTYQDIAFHGSLANNIFTINGKSNDSSANLDFSAVINNIQSSPSLKGNVDLKRVDLQKLNFFDSPLKLAGIAQFDFTSFDPDSLNGTADITSLEMIKGDQRINIAKLNLAATSTAERNDIRLISDDFSAHFYGKYQLTNLGQAFINQFNRYYELAPYKPVPPQKLHFDITIQNGKTIQSFVPAITSLSPGTFSGLLDTESDSLVVKGNLNQLVMSGYDIRDLVLDINNSNAEKLVYNLDIKSIEGPYVLLYNSSINGSAANNLMDVNMFLRDSKKQDKYVVTGNFATSDQVYKFSLNPNNLVLNYDKWAAAADNMIQYGKDGLFVRNFAINNSGQSFTLNSTSDVPNSPLVAEFKNFMLETITGYADQDSSLIGGSINGNVFVKDVATQPKFEADLTIDSLRYLQDKLGTATIKINNNRENAFQTDISLRGIHELDITGYYYIEPESTLDAKIDIKRFDLKYIESLSGGQARDGNGIVNGELTAKGPLTSPQLLGQLTFVDAGINIAKVNSYFKVPGETIYFKEDGIHFDNFILLDTLDNAALLNGYVATKDYKEFDLNLDLEAENFRAMNSTAADNELFYGTVFLDLQTKIRGNLEKPVVTFNARINENTKFTFVVPESDPTEITQEGVVEFIDMDMPPNNGRVPLDIDSLTRSKIKGMDVSGDLSIDKNAEIIIVVDERNGDALKAKGQAELSVQMDPSGKLAVTGRYELTEGSYDLTIGGFAKRQFLIQQGSSIQWTGAPTEANVDITALYTANVSPIDLVADQVQDLDQITRNTFRQRIPFLVYMYMKGQLMKPQINFQLDMRENDRNAYNGIVYTRIQQVNTNESEINKQAFSLLALNRFVSDNPFESLAGGTSVTTLARQSVSKLLTEQLNNLASDLINGVDINFDVESGEDYTTGTAENRTDLTVSFSKTILNDRLQITVGNNFMVEGPSNSNQQKSNFASNINLEYLISRDGRYRLRAYRRNQTQGIIEGQIIESGLGFVMVVNYNQFKEIFERSKLRKQNKKAANQ